MYKGDELRQKAKGVFWIFVFLVVFSVVGRAIFAQYYSSYGTTGTTSGYTSTGTAPTTSDTTDAVNYYSATNYSTSGATQATSTGTSSAESGDTSTATSTNSTSGSSTPSSSTTSISSTTDTTSATSGTNTSTSGSIYPYPTPATAATTGTANTGTSSVTAPTLNASSTNTSGTGTSVSPPTITSTATSTTPTGTVPSHILATYQKIQDLSTVVSEVKTVVDITRENIITTIDNSIADYIEERIAAGQTADMTKVGPLRDELIKKVDISLSKVTEIKTKDIETLRTSVEKGIIDIQAATGTNMATLSEATTATKENIDSVLDTLNDTLASRATALKQQRSDLLYKDSNKDGISDYDAINVYNISPTAPSPTSVHEGKTITAGEKILLGFDPTKKDLVKVTLEEPTVSTASIASTYKVEEVAFSTTNQVVIKGQALPNSYVTIYIYSTPVIVTVKTDANGEWQYTLDKELGNGEHTIYTATVNNAGNIVAKSLPTIFTKTAEAATLGSIPVAELPAEIVEPELLNNKDMYILGFILILIVIIVLALIGIGAQRTP